MFSSIYNRFCTCYNKWEWLSFKKNNFWTLYGRDYRRDKFQLLDARLEISYRYIACKALSVAASTHGMRRQRKVRRFNQPWLATQSIVRWYVRKELSIESSEGRRCKHNELVTMSSKWFLRSECKQVDLCIGLEVLVSPGLYHWEPNDLMCIEMWMP